MPNQWDLTNENIENTYQRVLQTPDGVNIYDGTGSLFTLPTSGVSQITAGNGISISPAGGTGVVEITSLAASYNTATGSYGSFYDTGSYPATSATTIYSMSLSTTDISNGVYVSGSDRTRIYVSNAGVYNFQFSAQFSNSSNNDPQDVAVWLRKNDGSSANDIVDSNSFITVPGAKGGDPGQIIAAWNFFLELAANDFVQLLWHAEKANVITLETIAAGTNPTHPRTPSLIATVQRVDTFLSNTGSFSGSFIGTHTGSFTGSFTGSLLGTASWADSASQASTASFYQETDPIFVAKSASLATTGSNSFNGNQIITGSLTITGSLGSVIEVSSSNSALRITQLGSGEAIRVEDSSNPDITSFIVDSSGSVGIGQFGPTTFSAPLYPIHIIASGGVDARLVFDGKQLGNAAANANITIAADTDDKVASFDFFDRKGVGYATASLTYAGPTVKFLLDRSGSSAPLVTGGARNQFYIINGYPNSNTTFRGSSSLGTIATLNISPVGVVSSATSFIAPGLQGATLYPPNDTDLNIRTRDGNSGTKNIIFGTGNSGSVPYTRMVISASGNVYISTGSLGVGTINPRTKLHIISGSSSGANVQSSDTAVFESNNHTNVSILSPTGQNSSLQFGSAGDILGAYVKWNQDNNLMTLGTANDGDNISFVTGNETSSMYLKNNTGLGIGTTAPLYRLHVRNGVVTNNSTFDGSVGVFENSGSNTFISILSHNNYNSAVGFGSNISRSAARLLWNHDSQNFNLATNIPSAFLTFGTGNETERMRITSGGLVGIGTTTPQFMLDVNGSARVTSSMYLPGLTSSPEVNVVLINTSSGQLYYTASSAIGGGGGGGPTAWGTITGDITAQSDLNTILAALETIKNFAGSFPG